MKLRIWCDSGANAHSKREETISLEDICLTKDEWEKMDEKQREDAVKEVAFSQLDWGYAEVF